MKAKLKYTHDFIIDVMKHYGKPCIFSSFGKDSVVMVHIIKEMGLKLPVVFWRDPFFPEKSEYANRLIREWNLSTYDYPPSTIGFDRANGTAHAINYHRVGGNRTMARLAGLVSFEKGKPYLCTLEDMLKRPLGGFHFPSDLAFHGHKTSDVDPLLGPIPLNVDILQVAGSNDYAYPLRYWNDSDIWNYIEEHDVPINFGRYGKIDGKWSDVKSKALNSDYHAACWRCIDRSEAASVDCPKRGYQVSNVSDSVHYDPLKKWLSPNNPQGEPYARQ